MVEFDISEVGLASVCKQKRKGDNWVFGYSQYTIHTHPPAPNPFQLAPHVSRRPGRLEAIRIATAHGGTIGYTASKEILQKQGLKLDTKTFIISVAKSKPLLSLIRSKLV